MRVVVGYGVGRWGFVACTVCLLVCSIDLEFSWGLNFDLVFAYGYKQYNLIFICTI